MNIFDIDFKMSNIMIIGKKKRFRKELNKKPMN